MAIDNNFCYEAVQGQLMLNQRGKDQLKNRIMGKIYSVLNPILENESNLKLSTLRTDLKKKGVELITKRTQTGENLDTIYSILFRDTRNTPIPLQKLNLKPKICWI